MSAGGNRIGVGDDVGDDKQIELLQCSAHRVGARPPPRIGAVPVFASASMPAAANAADVPVRALERRPSRINGMSAARRTASISLRGATFAPARPKALETRSASAGTGDSPIRRKPLDNCSRVSSRAIVAVKTLQELRERLNGRQRMAERRMRTVDAPAARQRELTRAGDARRICQRAGVDRRGERRQLRDRAGPHRRVEPLALLRESRGRSTDR